MFDDLIYDVGMHNGDDTAYYLYRGYRVVAIDADPRACENGRQRFRAELNDGRLTILNIGIADKAGTCDFWICESHPEWSSFHREIASREGSPHHRVPVSCLTLDTILGEHGVPHYLKVDIEGHDLQCVDALTKITDRPKYISVELGDLKEAVQKLLALGYEGFKCISQFTFVPLEDPPTPLQKHVEFWHRVATRRSLPLRILRNAIGSAGREWIAKQLTCAHRNNGWVFNNGSSGSFGDDTPGTWLTARQVGRTYDHYRQMMEQGKPSIFWNSEGYSFWTDLHARRN
ncbi:MAG: FkbM family methyltransferase [Solirubrobacterales bacterium]